MKKISLAFFVLCFFCYQSASAGSGVGDETQYAIASAHPLATEAGFEVINQGGNVFDAAVAVSAALAVVEPAGSGLGGGGFWLIHKAEGDFETMIDGREKAPMAADSQMFLNEQGNVIPGLSRNSVLSAGIPGVPAALVHIAKKYGKLPLAELLKPAIRYAREGFAIGERHRKLLAFRYKQLMQYPQSAAVFLPQAVVPESGSLLIQTDLANTLDAIAQNGRSGFYAGIVAEKLLKAVNASGGIWSQQDLDDYQVVEREPIRGVYRGIKVTSAAPPSSGGIVLLEALNILSAYELQNLPEVTRKHVIAEAMRRAYHDRALYLGDPDFITMPVKRLLDADYAAGLRATLHLDRVISSQQLFGGIEPENGGRNTTHFSIMDDQGNRVAATLSINFPFGSGFVAEGTGVLLNDEMDDFSSRPGAMNGYGLVGGSANAIAPGKRMLSSMSPTFLEDDDRIAVMGTPGGSRIISMVLLAILDFADGNAPQSWVKVPRFHHQFLPDEIQFEKEGLSKQEIVGLTSLGHRLKQVRYRYGNMQAVQWHKKTGQLSAASDPRGEGEASVRTLEHND